MDKKTLWKFILIAVQAVTSVVTAIAAHYDDDSKDLTKRR